MAWLKSCLEKLRQSTDPTADWAAVHPPLPDFDLSTGRLGSLAFGDGLEAAAFLGRPDRSEWGAEGCCELLYASAGFQIQFQDGKFAYLAFFIGADDFLPDHPALKFSRPRFTRGATVNRLAQDTERARLERLLGSPDSVDADEDETILYYTVKHITMEFERNGKTGRLKRWNLYPKNQPPVTQEQKSKSAADKICNYVLVAGGVLLLSAVVLAILRQPKMVPKLSASAFWLLAAAFNAKLIVAGEYRSNTLGQWTIVSRQNNPIDFWVSTITFALATMGFTTFCLVKAFWPE